MTDDELVTWLKSCKFLPGTVQMDLEFHESLKTPSVKTKVVQSMRQDLADFMVKYQKWKDDPIAGASKAETRFYLDAVSRGF